MLQKPSRLPNDLPNLLSPSAVRTALRISVESSGRSTFPLNGRVQKMSNRSARGHRAVTGGTIMRSGFSWQVALLALAAAAVLVPADASAQCAAMSGGGRGAGGGLAAGGGRGALSQGGAFVRNGSQAGSAMQMFLVMRQSQMLQQMNAMRQQQAMLSRQSAAGSQRMIPQMLSRPVTNRVASASATSKSKPTKSRQERLREAIQRKRRETEERRAASQSATRRRSGIIVFDGATRRSSR